MKLLLLTPICFAVPVIKKQEDSSLNDIAQYCQFNSDDSDDFCDGVLNGILAEIDEENREAQRREQERRELKRREQERRELEMRQSREQKLHNSIASHVINNYQIKEAYALDAPSDEFYDALRRIPFLD